MNQNQPSVAPPSAQSPLTIVGLGASAGGLEALEYFFGAVPERSGVAFVVVQHLDPSHKALLAELLQRATQMPVTQIVDGTIVEADHVYVIAPNKDLTILDGTLHLLDPIEPRGLRLPIDFFFRSLAEDQQERALAVILSGMGTDGAHGLLAVKEKCGATFVQEPSTAKFDSMPRAAVDTGAADVVAPPERLPGKIIDYVRQAATFTPGSAAGADRRSLGKVLALIRSQTGHDFCSYKTSTIQRRIARRMGLHGLSTLDDYARYLRETPQEAELLFKELLIGVTSFFRDPQVWDQLRDEIIPQLLSSHDEGGVLRAWSVGCSTGEEAFSLAMVFKEALEQIDPDESFSLQIFATDLDKDAIDKARSGIFPANIIANVSETRLRRFFIKQENGAFCVKKEVREMVIFAPQNLVMHPPFTKLDLVICRNLLIYLDTELQQKLMPLFHFALNPQGVLLLGSSETIGTSTDLFTALPGKSRLYRRLDNARPADLGGFPFALTRARLETSPTTQPRTLLPPSNLQSLADQLLLQRFSPAAVLVTNDGDILYVSGKTGRYLEPAAGKANWNLFAMCREGLNNALGEAFHKAVRQKSRVTLERVKVGSDDLSELVDVTVEPATGAEALSGTVMVVFSQATARAIPLAASFSEDATAADVRLEEMAHELTRAHEELQTAREEMQASQEDLRATNEELQSINEEMQSTNEELMTSKEEMQSMNEELHTVNQEMSGKMDELSRTGSDMKNLLDSVDIAILFLDSALLVRRFTPQAGSIIRLIPGDVGRPVTDLVTVLDYPDLVDDTQAVLRTLVPIEKQVATSDKRWFSVRILPYRTLENRVDGTVITLADITASKNLETALRQAQADLQERFSHQADELELQRKTPA